MDKKGIEQYLKKEQKERKEISEKRLNFLIELAKKSPEELVEEYSFDKKNKR